MHHAFTTDAAIERIAGGVEDNTLPKPEWTHAAHFAAALWILRAGRAREMPALIRAYNEATGVPNTDTDGYHATITLASLAAARARLLAAAPETPLHDTLNALLRSELGRSDWPLEFWTRPLLFSAHARRAWVAPDLKPFPYPILDVS